MRRLALAAFAAALLVPAAPATATPPLGGVKCGFAAVHRGTSQYEGAIAAALLGTGIVTCTIQAGSDSHGTNVVASATASGNGVVSLVATTAFPAWVASYPVHYCTTFSSSSGTYYWDASIGAWMPYPGGCPLAIEVSPGMTLLDPVHDAVNTACALLDCDLAASHTGAYVGYPDVA